MAKRRLSKDVVLDEATQVVDVDGRDELSLGRVAENLGVKSSALYNHVNGIDGLWQELAVRSTENLASTLRNAIVARSGAEALEALARTYRGFALDHPGQYALTILPSGDRIDSLAKAQSQIVELFVLTMHSSGLDDEEAVHAARIARSTIHGYVSLESIDALTRPLDRDRSFDRMIAMLVAQLPE